MDLGLKDKVVVVTGGASGLGLATAELFADEGAKLFLVDLGDDRLDQAASSLGDRGADVAVRTTDVRDYEACKATMAAAIERFGHIDALVNSAGIGGPATFFATNEPDDWNSLIDVNLRGVIHCCRAVTDHMIERNSGKIVSLASEAGKANEKRMAVYGATKGGVISLTRGLAAELGRHHINVNCVCPGVTHTPMTAYIDEEMERRSEKFYPLGRLGQPDDIAPMIAFLCSDRTSWVTGQAISVSGGFGRS